MKKRYIVGIVTAGIIFLGAIGSGSDQPQTSTLHNSQPVTSSSVTEAQTPVATPACDGTVITASCVADGVNYSKYVYYPAVAEKSHNETVTTYKQEISSYCTLCNDGTYSPSCATGRGACSHHGGVDQLDAPRYSNVPVNTTTTIIDAPAKEAYFDKIAE